MTVAQPDRFAPLFEQAARRLIQARSVDSLKRSLRTNFSLWARVDRLVARGELALPEAEAATLRRQARYVVDTLATQPVLNDDQIEQVIEINRQATEKLTPRRTLAAE